MPSTDVARYRERSGGHLVVASRTVSGPEQHPRTRALTYRTPPWWPTCVFAAWLTTTRTKGRYRLYTEGLGVGAPVIGDSIGL